MPKDFSQVEFTVFDTETTGLDPASGDRVVEIAAVRLKGSERLRQFQTLVNPRRPVSEGAFRVNGISDGMLKDAPFAEEALPLFLDFARESWLCSYNAEFDLGFLSSELKLIGKPALKGVSVVDPLKMARCILPGLERYSLSCVARHLGLNCAQEHRALADVEMTIGVFLRLQEMLRQQGSADADRFLQPFDL